jgi:hypothetical protein
VKVIDSGVGIPVGALPQQLHVSRVVHPFSNAAGWEKMTMSFHSSG